MIQSDDTDLIRARFNGKQGAFTLDAAFAIPAHGVTALFGPSGCGKTSLLRCVAGLNRVSQGYLSLKEQVWQDDGYFLPPHKRPVGYVFQEANLFPHLSVEQNLLFGRRRLKSLPTNGHHILNEKEVISLLGLEPMLGRSPARLSGGERQRVAIGRALLTNPAILLMDEPMAALDRISKNEILPYLETLRDELAIPVLYVSHDIAEVERLADTMVLMEKGNVRATGPLPKLLSNADLPLSRMPEAASILEGSLSGIDEEFGIGSVKVSGGVFQVPGLLGKIGQTRRLRVVASDVSLSRHMPDGGSSILNSPKARILEIQPFNDQIVTIFLRLGEDGTGASLLARITRKSFHGLDLKPGEVVQALIKSVSLVDEEKP